MLTELIELGQKNEKKQMKDTQNEIKQNIQGINSDRKETGTQSNNLEQKRKINIQQEQNEDTKFKKVKRDLGTSGTTWNIPIPELLECQKEKNSSKKLKTYLNK